MLTPKDWQKPAFIQVHSFIHAQSASRIFWFSKTELKHLLIGTLLVMGVGLTYFLYIGAASVSEPLLLAGLTIAFTLSFLLHEIAHKFSAQHFRLWAEFRLTMQGALITLVSVFFPPPFKIISPGAVMIVGSGTKEAVGKIAIAGPITNILLSAGCILIATVTQDLFWFVAFINAFLAVFNLIPFGSNGWIEGVQMEQNILGNSVCRSNRISSLHV